MVVVVQGAAAGGGGGTGWWECTMPRAGQPETFFLMLRSVADGTLLASASGSCDVPNQIQSSTLHQAGGQR